MTRFWKKTQFHAVSETGEAMSRWVSILATSPSGKTQYVCLSCGRVSPTPDKECPRPALMNSGDVLTLPCAEYDIHKKQLNKMAKMSVELRLDGLMIEATAEGFSSRQLDDYALVLVYFDRKRFDPGPWSVMLCSLKGRYLNTSESSVIMHHLQTEVQEFPWNPETEEFIAAAAGKFLEQREKHKLQTPLGELPLQGWIWRME